MEECKKGKKHRFKLKGLSRNRKSYRFRCLRCQARCVVFRNTYWRPVPMKVLWLTSDIS